eukprot:m.1394133 g.1394133  ORF g.1394133 m.1394133 type:complete len:138 (+) comp24992_c0_seq89:576-989(+)
MSRFTSGEYCCWQPTTALGSGPPGICRTAQVNCGQTRMHGLTSSVIADIRRVSSQMCVLLIVFGMLPPWSHCCSSMCGASLTTTMWCTLPTTAEHEMNAVGNRCSCQPQPCGVYFYGNDICIHQFVYEHPKFSQALS